MTIDLTHPVRAAAARNSSGAVSPFTSRSTRPSSKTPTASMKRPCGPWRRSPPSTRAIPRRGAARPISSTNRTAADAEKALDKAIEASTPTIPSASTCAALFDSRKASCPVAVALPQGRRLLRSPGARPGGPPARPDRRLRTEVESSGGRPHRPANCASTPPSREFRKACSRPSSVTRTTAAAGLQEYAYRSPVGAPCRTADRLEIRSSPAWSRRRWPIAARVFDDLTSGTKDAAAWYNLGLTAPGWATMPRRWRRSIATSAWRRTRSRLPRPGRWARCCGAAYGMEDQRRIPRIFGRLPVSRPAGSDASLDELEQARVCWSLCCVSKKELSAR